jgi:hypothetical protein
MEGLDEIIMNSCAAEMALITAMTAGLDMIADAMQSAARTKEEEED